MEAEKERLEAKRFKAEAERLEARLKAEKLKAERERLETERLEAKRFKAEAERLKAEKQKADRERLEAARLEAKRFKAERLKAEEERLEAERLSWSEQSSSNFHFGSDDEDSFPLPLVPHILQETKYATQQYTSPSGRPSDYRYIYSCGTQCMIGDIVSEKYNNSKLEVLGGNGGGNTKNPQITVYSEETGVFHIAIRFLQFLERE